VTGKVCNEIAIERVIVAPYPAAIIRKAEQLQ
jgi:hypothetical protein